MKRRMAEYAFYAFMHLFQERMCDSLFGYIQPQVSELLVRENELYKAIYCGLCKIGGKKVSVLTRFFLNNDFVFLCMVRMAVCDEEISVKKTRCPYSLKKVNTVCECEALVYTCAAFGILMYYKAFDDVRDKKGFGKLISGVSLLLAKGMRKKAAKLYPELESSVKNGLSRLYGLERSGCSSPDLAADCFAMITKQIASGNTEGSQKAILEECGYHIGRYVYLIDAFADCKEDERKNCYNVFNNRYSSSENVIKEKEQIKTTLSDSIMAFCRAYEKNGENRYDRLIYNTAQLGSANAFEKALGKLKGTTK